MIIRREIQNGFNMRANLKTIKWMELGKWLLLQMIFTLASLTITQLMDLEPFTETALPQWEFGKMDFWSALFIKNYKLYYFYNLI